jgi:hypothetical protein
MAKLSRLEPLAPLHQPHNLAGIRACAALQPRVPHASDNKKTGAVIVVTQRFHMQDLSGFLIDGSSYWDLLSLPAIAEAPEEVLINENNRPWFRTLSRHALRRVDCPEIGGHLRDQVGRAEG